MPSAWEKTYKALAVAAVILLVGALEAELTGDAVHAWVLFKLGLAAEASMVVCFLVALRRSRKR
jgi:hypothetical protein